MTETLPGPGGHEGTMTAPIVPHLAQHLAETLTRMPNLLPQPIEIPQGERNQKALATTLENARLLSAQGYRLEPTPTAGRFFCRRPDPVCDRTTGEVLVEGYDIEVWEGGVSCSCPAYERLGACKHAVWAWRKVANALRLVGAYLPRPIYVSPPAATSPARPQPAAEPAAAGVYQLDGHDLTGTAADPSYTAPGPSRWWIVEIDTIGGKRVEMACQSFPTREEALAAMRDELDAARASEERVPHLVLREIEGEGVAA